MIEVLAKETVQHIAVRPLLTLYSGRSAFFVFFFFQAEDGIRDPLVTGVHTCALPISSLPRMRPTWNSTVLTETTRRSVKTVEFHVGRILGKLGVASRSQAIVRAQQLGLVSDRKSVV